FGGWSRMQTTCSSARIRSIRANPRPILCLSLAEQWHAERARNSPLSPPRFCGTMHGPRHPASPRPMALSAELLQRLHRIHRQLSDLRERQEKGPRQVKAREANAAKLDADL